jgi:transcriptional regulator with XRE-family HTH domain
MKKIRATFRKKLGMKIRMLRLKKKLTQQNVAAGCLSLRAFQKIENGTNNARIDTICIIAIRLGIKPFELFNFPIDRDVLQFYKRAGQTGLETKRRSPG